jgi:hypothetical protein
VLPSIERSASARTIIVPRVDSAPPRSGVRTLLPWVVFGVVAVTVVLGTTLWSAALHTTTPAQATLDSTALDTATRAASAAPTVTTTPDAPAAVAAPTAGPVRHRPSATPVASRPTAASPTPAAPLAPATVAPTTAVSPTAVLTVPPQPPVDCAVALAAADCGRNVPKTPSTPTPQAPA